VRRTTIFVPVPVPYRVYMYVSETTGQWVELDRTPLELPMDAYEMFAFCASRMVGAVGTANWRAVPGVFSGGQNLMGLSSLFNSLQRGWPFGTVA
jgi:hypothetical protein